jgi:uncharacterized DUF497 family protein
MKIEYDPIKDDVNRACHGLSLVLARELERELLLATEVIRESYGEQHHPIQARATH